MANKILIMKHVEAEGPGAIEDFLNAAAWDLQTIELNAGDDLPRSLDGIDAVISMGGPMNVYEEEKYPFLKDEDAFLRKAVKERLPIMGICLGAQLLAKALGSDIKRSPVKEIGWSAVSLTEEGLNDALFAGLDTEIEVFQWHEDTFDIPDRGYLLAESRDCPNQAFGFADFAYGLQFHIETTPGMIDRWLRDGAIEKGERDRIIEQTHKKNEQFSKMARTIFSNFCRIVEDAKKARTFIK